MLIIIRKCSKQKIFYLHGITVNSLSVIFTKTKTSKCNVPTKSKRQKNFHCQFLFLAFTEYYYKKGYFSI